MSSALFILFVNTMVPLALTGGVGAETVELFDYVGALNGGASVLRASRGELDHLQQL